MLHDLEDNLVQILVVCVIALWGFHKVKTRKLESKLKKYESRYGKL